MIQTFINLRSLHRAFDAAAGVLERNLGTPICRRGCGLCCIVNTPYTSIIEGILMVSMLGSRPKQLKLAVEAAEEWLLEPHDCKVFTGVPIGFQSGPIIGEWQRLAKMQCPFMAENKDCILHECRGLVCRAYGVFRDSAELCPRPPGRGETLTQKAIIDCSKIRPLVREFFDTCKQRKPEWAIRGFVPTILFRAAKPDKLRAYINENKIASAKLIGMDVDTSLMWQPQIDDLRAGKTPAQVIQAEYVDVC